MKELLCGNILLWILLHFTRELTYFTVTSDKGYCAGENKSISPAIRFLYGCRDEMSEISHCCIQGGNLRCSGSHIQYR